MTSLNRLTVTHMIPLSLEHVISYYRRFFV